MTTGVGSKYWQNVVGIGSTSPVTKQLQNVNCSIGRRGAHITKDGARGSRSMRDTTTADGPYTVGGGLAVQPADDEWDALLPFINGGTRSGAGTGGDPYLYPLADTLPAFYVAQEKIAKVPEWAGCKVNRAVIRSSAASPVLTCEMDVQGKTETLGNSGTFPAISGTLTTDQPFLHQQLVCTLNSVVVLVDDVVLTIDNMLGLDRFLNSQTRTDLPEHGRLITLDIANPFNATDVALYNIAVAGISGSLVYTNGSRVLTFSFANLKAPPDVIESAARGESMLRLKFVAYETASLKELVTSLVVATPTP